jgi:hypothetical protein
MPPPLGVEVVATYLHSGRYLRLRDKTIAVAEREEKVLQVPFFAVAGLRETAVQLADLGK